MKTWLKAYQLEGKQGLIDNRMNNGKCYQNYMKRQKYRRDNGKPVAEMGHDELMETLTYLRAENAYLKKLEELAQKKRTMRQQDEKKPTNSGIKSASFSNTTTGDKWIFKKYLLLS